MSEIPKEKFANIVQFTGGINITPNDAGQLQYKISPLDNIVQTNNQKVIMTTPQMLVQALNIKPSQAKDLVKLINENPKDPSPETFIADQKPKKQNSL
ncbi:MAG: hypothetical protein MK132_25955 [Lentisphaerales bacterium]|nr:hypothetical protein [Lentisphaerales bacterium]